MLPGSHIPFGGHAAAFHVCSFLCSFPLISMLYVLLSEQSSNTGDQFRYRRFQLQCPTEGEHIVKHFLPSFWKMLGTCMNNRPLPLKITLKAPLLPRMLKMRLWAIIGENSQIQNNILRTLWDSAFQINQSMNQYIEMINERKGCGGGWTGWGHVGR